MIIAENTKSDFYDYNLCSDLKQPCYNRFQRLIFQATEKCKFNWQLLTTLYDIYNKLQSLQCLHINNYYILTNNVYELTTISLPNLQEFQLLSLDYRLSGLTSSFIHTILGDCTQSHTIVFPYISTTTSSEKEDK